MSKIKIIKKPAFDAELALTELKCAKRTLEFHLKRYGANDLGLRFQELFDELGKLFAERKI